MERDSLELLIKIQAEGQSQLQVLTRITQLLEAADKRATEASKEHETQTKRTGESMQGAFIKAQLLTEGVMKLAGAVKTYTVDAAQYAARTEQVAAVMDNLARVNGMSVQSVRQVADGIKELGITTQESRNVVNMMIGSQLDLSKSLDLTRLAQNAAKVAGISSSEALQRLVYAISSAQPEMLRTLGIQVSFENAYSAAAKAMGKQTNALTESEKTQIRMDAVLARSPLIDGSYVMSLTTAAGQMQSLQRYTDDLKNALGNGLQPALFDIVTGMEKLTKFAQENIDSFQQMTAGVTALGVAGTVFAATSFIPNPLVRGGIAAAAGAGTYALIDQDPVQASVDKYKQAFKKLEDQRKVMEHQLELGLVDEKAFKRFTDQLPAFRELLRARFIEENAELFKQRRAAIGNMSTMDGALDLTRGVLKDKLGLPFSSNIKNAQIPDSFDLGGGGKISGADILAVINGAPVKFDPSGLVPKNPLMNNKPTAGESAAHLLARVQQFQHILDALGEQGLDPLARMLLDTTGKLRDFTSKYGKLSGSDDSIDADGYFVPGSGGAAAAGRAFRANLDRAITKRNVPLQSNEYRVPSLEERGFVYGWQKTSANLMQPDSEKTEGTIVRFRERAVRGIQQYVQFQEQMVRLTAGPGGEAAAINTITALRIQGAKDEYAVSKRTLEDRQRMEEEIDAARKDRLLQIAQMQHAELERYRQAAGSIYDAMVSKGMGGIQDFLKGQLHVIGRTVFQNIAVEVFRTAKDSLKLGDLIGGQVDKNGKLTGLGRVLAGTPLGVDQSKLVLEQNTNETRLNTAAIKENTAAQKTGVPGGGKEAADAVGDLMDKGGTKLASKVQRMMGTVLTIGAGAYGIAQGIQQGGVKGALNTTAGIASMASGLIGSKLFGAAAAAGPWGGILAGAAAGIGLIASFFGQSKQKFDQEQTDTLNRNKYEAPVATNRTTDIRGGDVDYDYMGRLRTSNDRTTVIQLNVNAMDVKSFLDRSSDIAEALAKELRLGHRVSLDIVQSMLGA